MQFPQEPGDPRIHALNNPPDDDNTRIDLPNSIAFPLIGGHVYGIENAAEQILGTIVGRLDDLAAGQARRAQSLYKAPRERGVGINGTRNAEAQALQEVNDVVNRVSNAVLRANAARAAPLITPTNMVAPRLGPPLLPGGVASTANDVTHTQNRRLRTIAGHVRLHQTNTD
ncbi:hypothetical protein B0J14DRAFT_659758 [Halenospora varia]|nr:hypothetical protein B0J14DRAFT_659758 [Halenospora varia]